MKNSINTLAIVCLFFCIYLLLNFIIIGITTQPREGDSLHYHIPIAHSILNGKILDPRRVSRYGADNILQFYPSAAEAILALFIAVHLPLNLFNVFAWVLLFVGCYYLSRQVDLSKDISIIFATSVITLQVITRWLTSQVIDIWLAVFFIASLSLLIKGLGSNRRYFLLGICVGLLIGSKYTGIFFAVILILTFYRSLLEKLNLTRFILLALPIAAFGLSWYIRNFLLTGDPIYPQSFLFFHGISSWHIFKITVWEMMFKFPKEMVNAYLSEYMLWSLSLIVVPILFIYYLKSKKNISLLIKKLFIITVVGLVFYLFLVSSQDYNVMVSSFRYSYPIFIPLILLVFLFAKELKKLVVISYFCVLNLIGMQSFSYHPKILIFTFIVVLLVLGMYRVATKMEVSIHE